MTTGVILPVPVLRAVDSNGAPISGAQLQFYVSTTTTPTNVYTDDTLGTPLANPVVADSGGLFVPIFLDPTVTYRCQLLNATGGLIRDMDPVNVAPAAASQSAVNAGSVSTQYVSPATLAAWTGVAGALGYTPLNKAGDAATNLTLTFGTPTIYSAGYLGMPTAEHDANYTLAANDAGCMMRSNSGSGIAITIPPNASVAFPIGTVVAFRNWGAGTVTITRGAGVAQYIAGSGTNKDIALAQYGFCTLIQDTGNVWVATGVGIS